MTNLNLLRRRRSRGANLTDGGHAALNFINTYLQDAAQLKPCDGLDDYAGLVYWCQATGLIDWDRYMDLDMEGYCDAQEAKAVFYDALTLRAMLRDLFTDIANGEEPDEAVLQYFDKLGREVRAHLAFGVGEQGFQRFWVGIDQELKAPLWMIVAEAERLLTDPELAKVKLCPACQALFVDRSRCGNRRWCNPNTCGSLDKSRQYYDRKKRAQFSAKMALKNANSCL